VGFIVCQLHRGTKFGGANETYEEFVGEYAMFAARTPDGKVMASQSAAPSQPITTAPIETSPGNPTTPATTGQQAALAKQSTFQPIDPLASKGIYYQLKTAKLSMDWNLDNHDKDDIFMLVWIPATNESVQAQLDRGKIREWHEQAVRIGGWAEGVAKIATAIGILPASKDGQSTDADHASKTDGQAVKPTVYDKLRGCRVGMSKGSAGTMVITEIFFGSADPPVSQEATGKDGAGSTVSGFFGALAKLFS